MFPRLSVRRFLVIVSTLSIITLLVTTIIIQRSTWLTLPTNDYTTNNNDNNDGIGAVKKVFNSENINSYQYDKNQGKNKQQQQQPQTITSATSSSEENKSKEAQIGQQKVEEKLWFFAGGTEFPKRSKNNQATLFPDQNDGDRILEQLMYVPEDYDDLETPEKRILLYNGLGAWGLHIGPGTFQGCPVSRCSVTSNHRESSTADAILFKDYILYSTARRPATQLWILYYLECPYHTQHVKFPNTVNWTSTYRTDSDLVAPYERWTYYDPAVRQRPQAHDYSANKTKQVAWFVSNCGARNGRLAYAHELGKYIGVDIYGVCGTLACPRADTKCFEILSHDYKFYLAFENSNCRDYITEKFYVNGLGQNVLPIVMGARPEDYQRLAPERSYIHVDEFGSARELAAYLHRLDADPDLYNSYFRWKGTGEFINTYFWCRLCAMLHAPRTPHRHYDNVNEWWRGPGVCTTQSWRSRTTETEGEAGIEKTDK